MGNHLANSNSPYLLQHADNPVDWFPWDKEALERARTEQKPIFLSIGYSACHWCHVMAHESFEDPQVAAILNSHFISIKVDREERPDLDRVYMDAVQAMTGRGGWPLSVFLTPDGYPFYGGTYFPAEPRYGIPAFTDLLHAIVDAWRERRQELIHAGRHVTSVIELRNTVPAQATGLEPEALDAAFQNLQGSFDEVFGGWDGAPKFPQPMILEFLLRYHYTTHSSQALQMVNQTLEAMARGGIYDQLGGGFHRYSVDNHWLTPHFEKMSYDNSQLARVYLHAWQVTSHEFLRTIAEEILDYVLREMTDATGGFYSTQDADSEGEEGRFFVWTRGEIQDALGDEAEAFMAAYNVTHHGNFEGKNILMFAGDMDQRPALAEARRRLHEARKRRIHPGRDEKVLTAWNGLMLAAFAEAARALGREDFQEIAQRNADFLLRELRGEDGRLLRAWKAGEARLNGYLEDYAYLIEGLLELYQTTFETRWFVAAREIAETMIAHFQTPDGAFHDTSDDHETLITRPRELQDNATPSGSALAATALLKLGGLTGDARYVNIARKALVEMQAVMAQYPLGYGQWLQAASYALSRPKEIAIVGHHETPDTRALLAVVRSGYRPFQVVALAAPGPARTAGPLLVQDRNLVAGQATACVCMDSTCQSPVTSPEMLRTLLEKE